MNIRTFTLSIGLAYCLAGVLGFFPGLLTAPPQDAPTLSTPYGLLFGLFPVNSLHNIVHLGLGVWGLLIYKDVTASRVYARSLAVLYGVLAVFGLIPTLNTTFGLIPLFGHDVWLHLLTALAAAYFGFVSPVTLDIGHPEQAGKSGHA